MGRERSMATFKSHKDEDEDAPDRSGIALVSGEKIRRITCFGGRGEEGSMGRVAIGGNQPTNGGNLI